MSDNLLTVKQLAARCQVPVKTIRRWILEDRLPVVKCGRLVRFEQTEIEMRINRGNLLNA